MELTTAQRATLKANILATPEAAGYYSQGDLGKLAEFYNAQAAPAFTVWKTRVELTAVGEAFNSSEVGGLTTANTNRLMVMESYSGGVFNPSRADTRAGFDGVFSGAGGASTRAALLVLWKRTASRLEKLFATGTGSDAVPALLVVEGVIDYLTFVGI